MNTTLLPVRSPDREQQITVPVLPASDSRISLADRTSLRLGLWLLLRSTRNVHNVAERDAHHRHRDIEQSRAKRESAAATEQLLRAVRV